MAGIEKRSAKRNPLHQRVCLLCGKEFMHELSESAAQNYEFNKLRKYCSKECRGVAADANRKASIARDGSVNGRPPKAKVNARPTIAVAPARPVQETKQTSEVNIYRTLHENARRFAGCEQDEFDDE